MDTLLCTRRDCSLPLGRVRRGLGLAVYKGVRNSPPQLLATTFLTQRQKTVPPSPIITGGFIFFVQFLIKPGVVNRNRA